MLDDADVPAWWQRLGLPGLVDIHVHFMPKPVMDAVWRYFDDAERALRHGRGRSTTAAPTTSGSRTLRALGVRRFTALVYPHKPGMAEWLNEWARDVRGRARPGCVPTGTFFPSRRAADYVRAALDAGTRVFKVHVQVGGFDPRDAAARRRSGGMLAEAGVPVVVHCGSGPLPGAHTGPGPVRRGAAPRIRG